MAFYTAAGNAFRESITAWLQDTRLLSEAGFRLYSNYKIKGTVKFSPESWPKKQSVGGPPLPRFVIYPRPLDTRVNELLKTLWRSQFIFLETLWEEYLQALVLELRMKDASIFEPFCEKEFMAGIVRDVLGGSLTSIEEIKDEAAARFAAGLTRKPWKDQWAQLTHLSVGLTKNDEKEKWFKELDAYFEMRNCIIHRHGKVSSLLNEKTDYFTTKGWTEIEIWPQHLDYYRRQFLKCLSFIEGKIEAKVKANAPAPGPVGASGVSVETVSVSNSSVLH